MRIYEKVNKKLQQLKQNFKEKKNLNLSFQSFEMSKLFVKSKASESDGLLSRLSRDCDSFNPDPSLQTLIQLDPEELRTCAETGFLKMQKYSDE
jgi:hypothetical protein